MSTFFWDIVGCAYIDCRIKVGCNIGKDSLYIDWMRWFYD